MIEDVAQADRVVAFERGDLLFVFNFSGTSSYTDYRVGVEWPGKYKCVLCSDDKRFGGHGRVDTSSEYFTEPMAWNGRANFLQVGGLPIPSGTMRWLTREENRPIYRRGRHWCWPDKRRSSASVHIAFEKVGGMQALHARTKIMRGLSTANLPASGPVRACG